MPINPIPSSVGVSPGRNIANPIIVEDIVEDTAKGWRETRSSAFQKARCEWNSGRWNPHKAWDHYRFLCEQFDKVDFSPSQPLDDKEIPWPIYNKKVSLEGITWAAVEKFFREMNSFINDDTVYQRLLKDSQLR